MLDALKESLRFYRWLLDAKFRQSREEAVEILLMLVLGHAFGYYNPNQLADRLGLGNHIVSVRTIPRRDLLPLRRCAENVPPGTIQVWTVPGLVRHGGDAIHGLHGFGSTGVGYPQRRLALGTDADFKAIHNRLFRVDFPWGSHRLFLSWRDGAIMP